MNTAYTHTPSLAEQFWPVAEKTAEQRFVRSAFLAVVGSLLIAVSAKIHVPFQPVPMTLQTFAILTMAMAYGPRLGMVTILLYMAEGAAGLPVFSGTPEKGIGLTYMMGGTGGYLVGHVLATAICGWGAARGFDRSIVKSALVMLAAGAVIYIPGLLWLGHLYGWDKPILAWGLYPFVLGDLTKVVLAAVSLPLVWRVLGRRT